MLFRKKGEKSCSCQSEEIKKNRISVAFPNVELGFIDEEIAIIRKENEVREEEESDKSPSLV